MGQALVKLDSSENAPEKRSQTNADRCQDQDGNEQSKKAGEEAGEFDEDSMCRLAEGEFDLLPHEVYSLNATTELRLNNDLHQEHRPKNAKTE